MYALLAHYLSRDSIQIGCYMHVVYESALKMSVIRKYVEYLNFLPSLCSEHDLNVLKNYWHFMQYGGILFPSMSNTHQKATFSST